MAQDVTETVEDLKAENLELKLDGIREQFRVFKTDIHRHLDLLMENNKEQLNNIEKNTNKTNGSVARVVEKLAELEREDNKNNILALREQLNELKTSTNFWTTMSSNKWMYIPIAVAIYALTYYEFRQIISQVFKIIF